MNEGSCNVGGTAIVRSAQFGMIARTCGDVSQSGGIEYSRYAGDMITNLLLIAQLGSSDGQSVIFGHLRLMPNSRSVGLGWWWREAELTYGYIGNDVLREICAST